MLYRPSRRRGCSVGPTYSWRHRLLVGVVGLLALVSVEIAALPAGLLRPAVTVCVMQCASDGGECCCLLTGRKQKLSRADNPIREHLLPRHRGCAERAQAAITAGERSTFGPIATGRQVIALTVAYSSSTVAGPSCCALLLRLHGPRGPPLLSAPS